MIFVGTGWTLALAGCSYAIALGLGILVGAARTLRARLISAPATAFVEVFRNIPLIVQMFIWYFVAPELLPRSMELTITRMPQPWGQFLPALLCLSLYGTARVAEQVRSGILALGTGQRNAGLALGLSERALYRHVILPQALRIVIPTLTSELMSTVKYSSVALTIGLLELTGQARAMQEDTFHIFEAFSAATVIYLLLNLIVVTAARRVEAAAVRS